jgi:GNAT superfamily N-acetyltransferase
MPCISVISSNHEKHEFDCGSNELNTFLKTIARQHITKGISRTFVLTENHDSKKIIGFYTLSACEIVTEKMPKAFAKKYPRIIPAAKLARLAVDKLYQGQGYGSYMLIDSFNRIVSVSKNLGIVAFFVDAKNDSAASFYKKFGFIPIPDSHLELFIPIATIDCAFIL